MKVSACGGLPHGLDEIEGRTRRRGLPVIPGHQVVGRVAENGPGSARFPVGARVGVAWIFSACGTCPQCLAGNENLCLNFRATGQDADEARYMSVPEAFAHPVPEVFSDARPRRSCARAPSATARCGLRASGTGRSWGSRASGPRVTWSLKTARHLYPRSEDLRVCRSRGASGTSPGNWAPHGPGNTSDDRPRALRRRHRHDARLGPSWRRSPA